MKAVALIFVMALGLVSASLDLQLEDDFDIVDFDDALRKADTLRQMGEFLELADQMGGQRDKRFFFDTIDKIKNKVKEGVKKVGNFLTNAVSAAKDKIKKITSQLDFKGALDKLTALIDNSMNLDKCESVCKEKATDIFGSFHSYADKICNPLCKGALAQVKDLVG